MADTKISELTAGTDPSGSEILPAVQGGNTVSLTVNQILRNGSPSNGHYLTTLSETSLPNSFSLGSLTSGILAQVVSSNISTPVIAVEGLAYLSGGRIKNLSFSNSWKNLTNYAPSLNVAYWAIAGITSNIPPGTSGNVMTSDGTNWTSAAPSAGSVARSFGASVDGAGSNIVNGFLGYYTVGFSGTITGWSTAAKGTNPTCTYDIWKIATGPNVPTASQTITGGSGNRPALVTGNALRSTNMTNWTVNFTAGDIFGFNLDTTANATWAQILIEALS